MSVVNFGEKACAKVRGYLDSYLSNELLVETNHEVLRHLESCPQCTAELNTRARVRDRLRTAVRATPVPGGLEARVMRGVRAHRSRTNAGLYTLAVAAAVLICIGIINFTRLRSGPEDAILRKTSGQLAAVLNVGLRDHLHCAVFRKYPRRPETGEQMAGQLGPEFAGLEPLVKSRLPAGFGIIQAHRCQAGGREYVHLIVTGGSRILSLAITRKRPGESLSGGIHQTGVDRFQVVGFESGNYLVYIISDLDAQRNLQLAASLAPMVRQYLTAHQG
jgi:anti-sigma factor (TIGR02949 family)